MRHTIIVASLLAAVTLPAAAQTTTPSTSQAPMAMNSNAAMPMATAGEWRASKIIGVNVYNQQNEKLGDINEILFDQNGKVHGYIVGVGGFLGMGEHDIMVSMDQIKFMNDPMRNASNASMPSNNTTGLSTTTTSSRPVRSVDEKWYPDHAIMNANKDQLKAMPQFKYTTK